MKPNLIAVLASATALITSVPAAHAATQFYQSHILLNGQTVTSADHLVANDPSSNQPTSWIPIYYLIATLKDMGITSTWNGFTWNLNVPSSFSSNTSGAPAIHPIGANEMGIAINGTVVVFAPKITAPDPSGGTETTYAPIYYVMLALKRLGITPNWDGTNWSMTSSTASSTGSGSASGTGGTTGGASGGTGSTTGETQTAMANAMWNVFNATTWDVVAHPTMASSGVNPTSGTVTAGDVATWLGDWASKAKGYTAQAYQSSSPAAFVPFSLNYESSKDPYTWANQNDLYQGTSVTSGASVISPSDASQIASNLQWWLNGYKVVNGVYHLYVPMYGNYNSWTIEIQGHVLTEQQYQLALGDAQHYYDQVAVILSGNEINVSLPNVQGSASEMSWSLVDGSFQWGYHGGPSQTGDYGGATVKVPNNGPGIVLDTNSFKANNMGYTVAYKNVNGTLNFSPYDFGNGQSVN